MKRIELQTRTAHELLDAPKKKEDQDDSKHRLPAKTVNVGIINGMTEDGMLDQLHENGQLQWDIEGVREMLDGGVEQFRRDHRRAREEGNRPPLGFRPECGQYCHDENQRAKMKSNAVLGFQTMDDARPGEAESREERLILRSLHVMR